MTRLDKPFLSPGAHPARTAFERRSAFAAVYLAKLPRWFTGGAVLALVLVGAFVSGPVGAAALVLIALLLGWLAALSWPRLPPAGRLARVVAVLALLAFAGYQATR